MSPRVAETLENIVHNSLSILTFNSPTLFISPVAVPTGELDLHLAVQWLRGPPRGCKWQSSGGDEWGM